MVLENNGVAMSQSLGNYLRGKIKAFGTQEKFAEAYNVELRTVSRWVNNGVNSIDLLIELAEYFGDSVRIVIGNDDDSLFIFICINHAATK